MREMRKPILEPCNFDKWICVYWEEKGGFNTAEKFEKLLKDCSKAYNIKVNEPLWVELNTKKKDQVIKDIQSEFFKECKIVVVLVNRFTRNLYPAIK